jgi:hypothetical protein
MRLLRFVGLTLLATVILPIAAIPEIWNGAVGVLRELWESTHD